ncbi:MAG: glycosyltransferase family 2 protein [Gammaproteobacteria bacterium]|nr:MAG: glycosyltransferase family 2 protein [Gammaproteobacteria bacterium]
MSSQLQPLSYSVVIPVHDEQENILPLLDEIASLPDEHLPAEVVVVDDHSSDATPQRLAGYDNPRLRLVVARHARQCGQSTALRTGVRLARSPWIVTMDGDRQNVPGDIPALIATLRRQPEAVMVCGQRARRRDSALTRLASRVANRVRGALLGDRVRDTGCGLKLFTRQCFLDLPFFDHMHRFLPALAQMNGGQVLTCDVSHRPREHGRSKYGINNRLWVGIVDLCGVLWLKRRSKGSVQFEVIR